MSAIIGTKSANKRTFLSPKSDISDILSQATSDLTKSLKLTSIGRLKSTIRTTDYHENIQKLCFLWLHLQSWNLQILILQSVFLTLQDNLYPARLWVEKIKNTKGEIRTLDLTGMSRALSPTELPCHKSLLFNFHRLSRLERCSHNFYIRSLRSLWELPCHINFLFICHKYYSYIKFFLFQAYFFF